MTHTQLIAALTELKHHFNQRHQIGDFINQTLFSGSTPSVFDFGVNLEELLIDSIEERCEIPKLWIENFIYENDGIWTINGKEYDTETPQEFVDMCWKELQDFHIEEDK